MAINIKELISVLELLGADTEPIRKYHKKVAKKSYISEKVEILVETLFNEASLLVAGQEISKLNLLLENINKELLVSQAPNTTQQIVPQIQQGITIENIKELLNSSLKGLKNSDPNTQVIEAIKELNSNIKSMSAHPAKEKEIEAESIVELEKIFIDPTSNDKEFKPTNVTIEAKKEDNIQDKLKKLKQILKQKSKV